MSQTLVDTTPVSPNVQADLKPNGGLTLAQGLNAISLSPSQVEALRKLLADPRPFAVGDRVVLNVHASINEDGSYRGIFTPGITYKIEAISSDGKLAFPGTGYWYPSRFKRA